MSSLRYEFAPTGGGMEDGFNNSAIEHFVGNPSYYLARESIQNILDAATSDPVSANFSLFPLKAYDIPDYTKLHEIITVCSHYEKQNPKAKDFYINAHEALSRNTYLHVLRIDDYNTSGMGGDDDDREGDYHKFMKSIGISGKDTGSGGSFGLGKAAYYAASNFRMIFVSSIYEEEGRKKHMFQGKLLLNSFESEGKIMQGDGSFGLLGQKAVRDSNLIPKIFKRSETGTSIFIIGFSSHKSWEKKIMRSVLENFWPAIVDERLEVQIGKVDLSGSTIGNIIKKEYSLEDPDTKKDPNPLPYFLAYTATENNHVYEKRLETLGKVGLYTLTGPKLPNKTACSRSTGMVVQKKGRYYCAKEHASFFYCTNEEGSEVLKRMENPRHDEWEADNWITTAGEPEPKLKDAERELWEFIKEAHERFGSDTKSDSIHIPNLEQYLFLPADDEDDLDIDLSEHGTSPAGPSEEETGSEIGALESELKKKKRRIKPIKLSKQPVVALPGGEDLEMFGSGTGDGGGKTPTTPAQPSPEGEPKVTALPISFRSFFPQNANNDHVIKLNNIKSQNATIEIYGVTEDGYLSLPIDSAKNSKGEELNVSKNKIVNLSAGGSEVIKVKFSEKGRYSLSVKAYEE